MLSKPYSGWSEFRLDGTSTYNLSYLDDIAFEWLDAAINGLETMLPFCVKGFLEPRRFLCMVSYWNCHIIIENDDRYILDEEDMSIEYSHTSMLEFCKYLYDDISEHIEEWASFIYSNHNDEHQFEEKKLLLKKKLQVLYDLILLKEEHFGGNRCFL